jgi:hypothetical protein
MSDAKADSAGDFAVPILKAANQLGGDRQDL